MTGANGGQILDAFMKSWADADADMVTNAIRVGYALGETNEQILARVRGSAALNFSDGVLATNRAHAATVVRTAVQHVANQARAAIWEANSDIIDQYQWVSTLDSRTTPICRDRDLDKFEVGKGPLPPAHPNCRSTTVAVLKGALGEELEKEGTRASVDGQVKASESYYDWLQKQPADFQDLALGPTRGKLFRDGGLSNEDFSRLQLNKNFEPATLAQMRELEPAAFARAGLGGQIPEPLPSPLAAPAAPFEPLSLDDALRKFDEGTITTPVPGGQGVTAALKAYTGSEYREMNSALRGLTPLTPALKTHIDLIAEALDGAEMLDDAYLYRGMDAGPLVDDIIRRRWGAAAVDDVSHDDAFAFRMAFKPSDLVGEVFDDGGFMSFSLRDRNARTFTGYRHSAVLRIAAPRGTRGYLSLESVTAVRNEVEVLRRGGRFRIVGWDEDAQVLLIEAVG
jgi:SPP1 gp7 family putative phage head morphogenesis protein